MRPTFQNIDCFKDKMASITGMLTFSTVNPENFSLIPLYHPENKANFWLPNTLKHAMFTPDFRKKGKMQAVSMREAWNWPCWFSFMCHSQLTTIVNSNKKYKKLCKLEAIFWIPNVLKRFMEGFGLHNVNKHEMGGAAVHPGYYRDCSD